MKQVYILYISSSQVLEIEIKIPCENRMEVYNKLNAIGATKIGTENNFDIYFNHPEKDFATTDEALRFRVVNQNYELTYKGPKIDDRSKTREEINLKMNDQSIIKILQKLDFVESGTVRKQREVWKLRNILINVDQVENLGDYVELEIISEENKNMGNLVDELYTTAKSIGLDPSNQIRKSYLELCNEI